MAFYPLTIKGAKKDQEQFEILDVPDKYSDTPAGHIWPGLSRSTALWFDLKLRERM